MTNTVGTWRTCSAGASSNKTIWRDSGNSRVRTSIVSGKESELLVNEFREMQQMQHCLRILQSNNTKNSTDI